MTAAGLVGPATLYVAVGLLVPLAILLRYSLNQFVPGKFMVDALTIENYVKFFTDIYYTAVLTRTVRIALITTIICLLLGFPLAYVLARTRTRFKNILIMLVVLPLFEMASEPAPARSAKLGAATSRLARSASMRARPRSPATRPSSAP